MPGLMHITHAHLGGGAADQQGRLRARRQHLQLQLRHPLLRHLRPCTACEDELLLPNAVMAKTQQDKWAASVQARSEAVLSRPAFRIMQRKRGCVFLTCWRGPESART